MLIENEILAEFADLIEHNRCNPYKGKLKVGVDLGTANIVLAVVDEENHPIAGATAISKVVKDGIVVDYIGAIKTVVQLKTQLEDLMGTKLDRAATAVPPGIITGNIKCIANVVEGAGFEVTHILDEPTVAATVLKVTEGAVVDVGGGTTGISILKDGKVIFTADEPTGGTHMSLVLAGYHGISVDEAEKIKKDATNQSSIFPIVKPVVEKMASIVKKYIKDYEVPAVYVVGGAACFDEFEAVFEKEIGIKTIKPNNALLVTPLGIAFNCI